MSILRVPIAVVTNTLQALRAAGARNSEGIVLWLGKREGAGGVVEKAYEPLHEAAMDYFRIPPQGMRAVMREVEVHGGSIVAQVHSHPFEAFHSKADDAWAIVRHVNAFSLVVPRFARDTTVENFTTQIAVFQLSSKNAWLQGSGTSVALY